MNTSQATGRRNREAMQTFIAFARVSPVNVHACLTSWYVFQDGSNEAIQSKTPKNSCELQFEFFKEANNNTGTDNNADVMR